MGVDFYMSPIRLYDALRKLRKSKDDNALGFGAV
jgi:hypothetical protein